MLELSVTYRSTVCYMYVCHASTHSSLAILSSFLPPMLPDFTTTQKHQTNLNKSALGCCCWLHPIYSAICGGAGGGIEVSGVARLEISRMSTAFSSLNCASSSAHTNSKRLSNVSVQPGTTDGSTPPMLIDYPYKIAQRADMVVCSPLVTFPYKFYAVADCAFRC